MSNFLNGVFTPRYTWSSVTGFETRLDTSLAGNTTIGDSTTNYSLLLNGLPLISGSDISSWSLYPAVSQVNLSLHDLSGIASFNGVGAKFDSTANVIAIGSNAGSNNIGIKVNAIGTQAAANNSGDNVNAIGYQAAAGNTSDYVNAIGHFSALYNSGTYVNATGYGAAACNTGANVNAIGSFAAYQNTGSYVAAMGLSAAYQNNGCNVNAIGNSAAYSNQGANVNAIGSNTAESNVGWFVNAIGNLAASNNTSDHVNAFGTAAASGNSGANVNAIGNNAAANNTGSYVNAFGCNAGIGNTGNNCTFIGKNPNIAVINNLSDRLIVYSSSNNPLLYGDTSNMSLGIGTTTLSAALTVSGKICATGILDTVNSTGTANQVLTAGTGGGSLVWASSSVGGVASVTAGTGISVGGTITNPSVAIADIGSSGIYAYPSSVTTNSQGQVTSITAGSNYPYIWQYTKAVIQHLSSDGGGAGTYITWDTTIYEQPGYTSALTPASDAFIVPLTGWYQITFVGSLGGAAESGSGTGYVPQGGGNNNIPKGTVSQFTYGIRLNNTPVPGWQGYLNGYVVGEVGGVQTQLVVIYKLNSNSQIAVDNETLAVGGLGDFTANNGTMLTITYLRP